MLVLRKQKGFLSSILLLAVTLFQLSEKKARELHGIYGIFILALQKVFAKLCIYPPVFGNEEKKVIEKFLIIKYERSSAATDIDSAILDMFGRKQKSYDAIPQLERLLEYHTKRAAYQTCYIWGQAITRQMEVLSPSEWGWKQPGCTWQIVWTSIQPVSESSLQLTKCGYKKA